METVGEGNQANRVNIENGHQMDKGLKIRIYFTKLSAQQEVEKNNRVKLKIKEQHNNNKEETDNRGRKGERGEY